ncbi:MAG: prenyltransferase/squalene oxidase repeat-containing protein [Gemmataceae bacterium]
MLTPERIQRAYETARTALLAERRGACWRGELSSSALSTAVAASALAQADDPTDPRIEAGLRWLARHQNDDGGWGDTTLSVSNISTTMLCRAAFYLTGRVSLFTRVMDRCEAWLRLRHGRTPAELAEAVRARYGNDRTFSVPILMTSALARLMPWHEVPTLPFELACFPQSWYRFLQLPVVSYALPALIAIGQAVQHHRGSWAIWRPLAIRPSLRVLERIQPSNGGFLEATPLTAFVSLALASTGRSNHPVVRKGLAFLRASQRDDGAWPIDTDLATWVTTLATNALAAGDDLGRLDDLAGLGRFLLDQQYRERHPYTGADPGAWAWTNLPGAVPDADDTPGALLALHHLARQGVAVPREAIAAGIGWLLDLQNRDGGWPTFCRGWGLLPFDRSGSDLTAHALRALQAHAGIDPRSERAIARGLDYLAREQRGDGSWLPLWFGNQHAPDDINPTYGTSRVLAGMRDLQRLDTEPARRAIAWLVTNQNDDGGWGGLRGTPSSIEETALALEPLLATDEHAACERGLAWLIASVEAGRVGQVSPIGFYFAKLWYHERLYPLVYTVAALGRAVRRTG